MVHPKQQQEEQEQEEKEQEGQQQRWDEQNGGTEAHGTNYGWAMRVNCTGSFAPDEENRIGEGG